MALVTTKYGEMDDAGLLKSEGAEEDDDKRVSWVEYRLDGEIVHRSVAVALKKPLDLMPALEGL